MTTQRFTQGRIRQADHDPRSQQLDLHFTTYWEDRIAEEYPKAVPARRPDAAPSAKAWDELFDGKLP